MSFDNVTGGTATVLQGNALSLPLTDASVDLICTSPPYFGLRSYQDNGEHYDGQIGAEPTPAEFVDALICATREMMRVLKPSGSIWVNLGDKYAGSDGTTVKAKSLIGIPWRYALRCIDDLGLILRAEIIWSKPNGLPESVTDRVRRSHETWFHFVKQPRYFSAVDEIREEHLTVVGGPRRHTGAAFDPADKAGRGGDGSGHTDGNPLGKLPGSVWTIATQPLTVPAELGVDHFAAFPMEWPRRIIQGWSPRGICTACGEGRRPIVRSADGSESAWQKMKRNGSNGYVIPAGRESTQGLNHAGHHSSTARPYLIEGETCACDSDGYRNAQGLPLPPTTPATILDPFGGTGTTALLAKTLGRTGISVDMSADYSRLAEWRTTDPKERVKSHQKVVDRGRTPAQIKEARRQERSDK